MTLALTAFESVTRPITGPSKKRGIQEVRLAITAANTDTSWDIASITSGALGTFWTAAVADATYGSMATAALAVLQNIQAQATSLRSVRTEGLLTRSPVSGGSVLSFLSSASGGGAAAEAYTVTGLLATDVVLAVTPAVAAATRPEVLTFLSSAYGGGSATPTVTVTGLLATDTIIAVSQVIKGSNNLPLLGYNTIGAGTLHLVYSADPGTTSQVEVTVLRSSGAGFVADSVTPVSFGSPTANTLTVTYGADPGAGAKVKVAVYRANGSGAPLTGEYGVTLTGHLPTINFASGDAPTTATVVLELELADNVFPTHSSFN